MCIIRSDGRVRCDNKMLNNYHKERSPVSWRDTFVLRSKVTSLLEQGDQAVHNGSTSGRI